jgi:uroporphyrinogen decarboxylase
VSPCAGIIKEKAMTHRERIRAALRHQTPDRTPIFEYVLLSPLADHFLGHRYAGDLDNWADVVQEKGWANAVRQSAVDQLELALRLGSDMLYAIPNRLPPPDRPAPAPDPADTPADPVARLELRNAQDARRPPPHDDTFLVYALLKQAMTERGVDLPILAPAYAHGVWTDTDLMETMLLAPEVAARHFELATVGALAHVEKYLALGIDQIGVGGDFSGTRPLISPAAYAEFIVPEVRTMSRRIHAAHAFAINASDGNLWPVLDDFLFGCEVDGYLEIDLHAGMTMEKLKPICRGRVTLYGNMDCGNTLSFCTPAEVRRATIDCIEAGRGDGGHILCASNAITASVPLENYLAAVNAYREVFCLPPLAPG